MFALPLLLSLSGRGTRCQSALARLLDRRGLREAVPSTTCFWISTATTRSVYIGAGAPAATASVWAFALIAAAKILIIIVAPPRAGARALNLGVGLILVSEGQHNMRRLHTSDSYASLLAALLEAGGRRAAAFLAAHSVEHGALAQISNSTATAVPIHKSIFLGTFTYTFPLTLR